MNASASVLVKPSSAVVPFEFDFKNPDYISVFRWRAEFLLRIRKTGSAEKLKVFYAENPIQFIIDWGVTFEPRNPEIGLPTKIPFVLFQSQIDWCQWVLDRWRARERGMNLKSRGSGVSWLAVSLASTLCLFNRGLSIGMGSRLADYVDALGNPKSLFFKARMFLNNIPPEFRFGWNEEAYSQKNLISFPHTESMLSGEVGDNIGRGNRTSIYFVDEAQPLSAKILTPTGWSTMGEMRIGSEVLGPDGSLRRVVGINNCGVQQLYRVRLNDGTFTECSEHHLWRVDKVWGKRETSILRTNDLIDKITYESPGGQVQYVYRLPICQPINFYKKDESFPCDLLVAWQGRQLCRTIVGIDKIDYREARCITVDAEDGLYVTDEFIVTHNSGFLEHPEMAEASLSDTTNCRIDISTSPGSGTVFADRYEALPDRQKFFFHWRDDPRRGPEWHAKKLSETPLQIFNREYEGSLDEFGEFFTKDMFLVDGHPVDMPDVLEAIYAVIDSANKSGIEHDGLAVVYFGIRPDDQLNERHENKIVVLDWHLTQIDAAFLINWLPSVFVELESLAKECRALQGSLGAWIEDKASGIVLLQQAANQGLQAQAIDSKLTALGKAERGINVSSYIHGGQVKFTRRAYEKVVTYKAVTKNHLLSQALSFRAGVKDMKQDDALDCLTYGIAIGTGNAEGF